MKWLLVVFVPFALTVFLTALVGFALITLWRTPWLTMAREYPRSVGRLAVYLWSAACQMWRA